MDTFQDNIRSLRAAIVWALELADAQGDHLVAAFLSQALDATERNLTE
ncbi:hypothetical protein VH567_11575 [Sphingomonas sp. 4RDLI-65]